MNAVDILAHAAPLLLLLIWIAPFVAVFLPYAWMVRLSGLSILALMVAELLDPPQQDPGFGYALAIAMLTLIWLCLGVIMILRTIYVAKKAEKTGNSLRLALFAAPVALDVVLGALAGLTATLLFGAGLAALLAGSSWGQAVHLAIAIMGLTLAAGLGWYAPPRAKGLASFGLGMAMLAIWGLSMPDRMLRSAAEIADPNPWCISLPHKKAPLSSRSEAMFFTSHKAPRYEHATLVVEGPERLRYHWSFHYQAFHGKRGPDTRYRSRAPGYCDPVQDFERSLPP